MKLLPLLLSLLVAGCASSTKVSPTVEILRPSFLEAVRPIQYLSNNGQALANGCTAASINREERLWLTAAHCVVMAKGDQLLTTDFFIMGLPGKIVEARIDLDLAVIQVLNYFPGGELKRASSPPRWEEEIRIVGYPLGYEDPFITKGTIANPLGMIDGISFMLFNVAAAPGNSGSPVINSKGEIVSVLQIGWSRSFSPVTGGATYEAVKWFDRYFIKLPTVQP